MTQELTTIIVLWIAGASMVILTVVLVILVWRTMRFLKRVDYLVQLMKDEAELIIEDVESVRKNINLVSSVGKIILDKVIQYTQSHDRPRGKRK